MKPLSPAERRFLAHFPRQWVNRWVDRGGHVPQDFGELNLWVTRNLTEDRARGLSLRVRTGPPEPLTFRSVSNYSPGYGSPTCRGCGGALGAGAVEHCWYCQTRPVKPPRSNVQARANVQADNLARLRWLREHRRCP